MSDNTYFRATIDIAVFTADFAKELRKNLGDKFNDEQLGRRLFDQIQLGNVEIDAISHIEDHS